MDIKLMEARQKYIHRDISWLMFNERVIEEAEDISNPLLERLKFLGIAVNNLDEFLMVRYAGALSLFNQGYTKQDSFGYYPGELVEQLRSRVRELNSRLYDLFSVKILPEMKKNNISLREYTELNQEQKKQVKIFFENTIFPTVTPMAVDQGHPFPALSTKTISFAIKLKNGKKTFLAVLPLPKSLPRVFKLKSSQDEFIVIDDILRNNLEVFFRGYEVVDVLKFRILRDSELDFEEEESPDLLETIENSIRNRARGKVVYLEAEAGYSKSLMAEIC
ncbi:MAG: hypothetical protein WCI43_02935, partial [Candidatus Firestonebacteria bacterium]